MNNSTKAILNTLSTLSNTMVAVTYKSDVQLNKKHNPLITEGKVVTKESTTNLLYTKRSYADLNGLTEVGGLPYGEWIKGAENRLLRGKNDLIQVRFYATADTKTNTTYFVDGKVATKEEVEIIKAHLPKHGKSTEKKAFEPRNITADKITNVEVLTEVA